MGCQISALLVFKPPLSLSVFAQVHGSPAILQQYLKEISDELSYQWHASHILRKPPEPASQKNTRLWTVKESQMRSVRYFFEYNYSGTTPALHKTYSLNSTSPQKLQGSSRSSIKTNITFCTLIYVFVFLLLSNLLRCLFEVLRRCWGMHNFFWLFHYVILSKINKS